MLSFSELNGLFTLLMNIPTYITCYPHLNFTFQVNDFMALRTNHHRKCSMKKRAVLSTIHGIQNCDITKTLLTYSIFFALV